MEGDRTKNELSKSGRKREARAVARPGLREEEQAKIIARNAARVPEEVARWGLPLGGHHGLAIAAGQQAALAGGLVWPRFRLRA